MNTQTTATATETTTANLPKVGDEGSYSIGSDRYAVTVAFVSKSGHRVVTRDAIAKLTSGDICANAQVYEFKADPNGNEHVFTRRGDGVYRLAGCTSYGRLNLNGYSAYRDPSF